MNNSIENVCTLNDEKASPEAVFEKKDVKRMTSHVLNNLKDKEKKVLMSRFAFESRKKQTLKDIAIELGVSTETVRQIEMKALKKIKNNYSYLRDYIYC